MTNPLEFVSSEAPDVAADPSEQRERRDLLVALRDGKSFGLFAAATDGIVEWKDPTPLPRARPAVLGLVCVRGRMFTVIDPAVLLDRQPGDQSRATKFIVLLAGDDQLALAVERVSGINEVFVDEVVNNEGAAPELVLGHSPATPSPIAILNPDRIFAAASQ